MAANNGCNGNPPPSRPSGSARRNNKIDRGLGGMQMGLFQALAVLLSAMARAKHANPSKSSCT